MNLSDLFRHETDTLSLPQGQTLFKAGESGAMMYVLKSGTMDILVGNKVVETAQPGALIGEMALIDKGPRAATAVAHTDCELVGIDLRRFLFLVQQTPNFAIHVMHVMADRLRNIDTFIQ
jgi:CRP/FNR family transcriptional regulator, cyclic AMP receptor protein